MAEAAEDGRSSDIPGAQWYCRHHENNTPLQYEEESKEICIVMSWLGHEPSCRQKRRDCYSEYARLLSAYLE
ncbi:hypothetical protein DPMN_066606 [Dreissena polymorpha]|uniref:Uncharacterized protein n=1 Tax=Dreissena polymorpha TaxID=45954 RepID=A0A9D4BT08_DREPO|nr:hypothetical protein DPMN_066606 [Dreissena polymorpha]